MSLVGIVGVIIAYVSRGDARGTWAESHLTWLIRTFWWSLLWNVRRLALSRSERCPSAIRSPASIWVATAIWVIYRVIRGYLLFHDERADTVAM